MLGKQVKIDYDDNFYDGMYGTVIEEYPQAVKVEISYGNDSEEVVFYKDQVEVLKSINEVI